MFSSPIVDVAIGLVFCYAALALTVSTITEAISSGRGWRSTALFGALKSLLNDPQFKGLALKVFNHALVSPLGTGTVAAGAAPPALPSYVPSAHFATALIDAIQDRPGDFESFREAAQAIEDPQLKQMLLGLHAQAGLAARASERFAALHAGIADLFDNAMDRLSGQYKRRTQAWTFGIALVAAAVLNIDSVHLLQVLWAHPTLASALAAPGGATDGSTDALAMLGQMQALPVGWTGRHYDGAYDVASAIVGIICTALTAVFGAPFWFDALQRLTRLRGTGPKSGTGQAAN